MVVKVGFVIERDHGEWKTCVFVGTIELVGLFIGIASMSLTNVSEGLYTFSTKTSNPGAKLLANINFSS